MFTYFPFFSCLYLFSIFCNTDSILPFVDSFSRSVIVETRGFFRSVIVDTRGRK